MKITSKEVRVASGSVAGMFGNEFSKRKGKPNCFRVYGTETEVEKARKRNSEHSCPVGPKNPGPARAQL